jgi:PIN domain nuclease of toxin-antitoxin system
VRLLLDTHTFLWFVNGDPKLSVQARTLIEDVNNERQLSIASIWEMAIKASTGRLRFTSPFDTFITEQMRQNSIDLLAITVEHTAQIINLPYHHRDPFDRLLIVQSMVEQTPIISVDAAFDAYPIIRFW